MYWVKRIAYLFLFIVSPSIAIAQDTTGISVGNQRVPVQVTNGLQVLIDRDHKLGFDSVRNSNGFTVLPAGTPNLDVTSSAAWIKFKIKNETGSNKFIVKLSNPGLDSVDFYEGTESGDYAHFRTGQSIKFTERPYHSTDYLFPVTIAAHSEKNVFIKVSSFEALVVPLSVGIETVMLDQDKNKDLFWGMYIGLMLAMLFYNGFVFVTTKDKSYLYYIFYVLAVLITQTTLSGYAFEWLWPQSPIVAKASAYLMPPMVGIAGIQFMRHFLKTSTFIPKLDKGFIVFITLYILAMGFSAIGKYNIGFTAMDMTAASVSIYMLALAIIISKRGYRPAVFFLISWIIFLVGVFIFVFKNFNLLPYNNFTVYTMPVGSAMEVLLLSFALADRINILKKEKEQSQAQTMDALQENERIVREQNLILEARVTERTFELKIANDGLSRAMVELKEAESQLVESEKMASLGQLTAGIAHEINNPINFVTSNVKPLNRDVHILIDAISTVESIVNGDASKDERKKQFDAMKEEMDFDYLKIEIDQLLNGIGDGASRTAEIVKGLRIFSRLDEDDLKKADINEGLDSTLVITNNLMGTSIKVEKEYTGLPLIECYPGKLNQVFLNIISNAIYAIKKKFDGADGGMLTIKTWNDDDNIYVSIEDNGTGMDEKTKKRLFEPFFTTKEVGEGTGLGLSITYNTILKHNGKITVNSELGIGTQFILSLPLTPK